MSEHAVSQDFLGVFGVLERGDRILLAGNRRQLQPGAAAELVFDLPGGQVEPGELLVEALRREWREECDLEIEPGEFLFVQEGLRTAGGLRCSVWRSFFFRVASSGEARPCAEVESLLWAPRSQLELILHAPYHQGFRRWLRDMRSYQFDEWD